MISEKIRLDKELSSLLLEVFSKHSLEKGKLYSFELANGQNVNVILPSEGVKGSNVNYVNLSDEEIRAKLKGKVLKDDDSFGAAVPEEDWEVYN